MENFLHENHSMKMKMLIFLQNHLTKLTSPLFSWKTLWQRENYLWKMTHSLMASFKFLLVRFGSATLHFNWEKQQEEEEKEKTAQQEEKLISSSHSPSYPSVYITAKWLCKILNIVATKHVKAVIITSIEINNFKSIHLHCC